MNTMSDSILIKQLKAKVNSLNQTIDSLGKQRQSAIEMLKSFDEQSLKATHTERKILHGSKRRKIIDAVIELAKMHKRPVTAEEILSHVKIIGLNIGDNHVKQRSFLGAVLSSLTSSANKGKSPIMRIERGIYDMKK